MKDNNRNQSEQKQAAYIHHDLPLSIGNMFKGRTLEMEQLNKRFSANNPLPQVLYGTAGVGKSRLAVEYALDNLDNYTSIVFIKANTPSLLFSSINSLLGTLNKIAPNQFQKDYISVLKQLDDSLKGLVILDNVDDESITEIIINNILIYLRRSHVIITSKYQKWSDSVCQIKIQPLSIKDSTEYLLEKTHDYRVQDPCNDSSFADKLSRELDGLPIALEQAGAYICRQRIEINKYLDIYFKCKREILAWRDCKLVNYPVPVLAAWNISLSKINKIDRSILNLASCFGFLPIPLNIFLNSIEHIIKATALLTNNIDPIDSIAIVNVDDVQRSIENISDYSIVHLNGDEFTLHKITNEILWLQLEDEKRSEWVNWGLKVLNIGLNIFTESDDKSFKTKYCLYNHFQALVDKASTTNIIIPSDTLRTLSISLLIHNRLKEADVYIKRALEFDRVTYGVCSLETLKDLCILGQLLVLDNNYLKANKNLWMAIEISKKLPTPDYEVLSDIYFYLAIVKNSNSKNYRDTIHLIWKSMDLELSLIEGDQKRYLFEELKHETNVEDVINKTFNTNLKIPSKNNIRILQRIQLYSLYLCSCGQYSKALRLLDKLQIIIEIRYGKENINLALVLSTLGDFAYKNREFNEASILYGRTFEIYRKYLSLDNTTLIEATLEYVCVLMILGKYSTAKPILCELSGLLGHDKTIFSERYSIVITTLNNVLPKLNNKETKSKLNKYLLKYNEKHDEIINIWIPILFEIALKLRASGQSEEAEYVLLNTKKICGSCLWYFEMPIVYDVLAISEQWEKSNIFISKNNLEKYRQLSLNCFPDDKRFIMVSDIKSESIQFWSIGKLVKLFTENICYDIDKIMFKVDKKNEVYYFFLKECLKRIRPNKNIFSETEIGNIINSKDNNKQENKLKEQMGKPGFSGSLMTYLGRKAYECINENKKYKDVRKLISMTIEISHKKVVLKEPNKI